MARNINGGINGVGLAILASAAFGTSGTFATTLMRNGWSPTAVVAVRVSIAALVLAVPAIISLRGRWHLLWRNMRSVTVFGFVGVAGCQVAYFEAVERLSVSVALLLEYLAVILIVGWQWARHGVVPGRRTVAGSAAAVVGLLFVLDVFGHQHLNPVGVLWGLVAAVFLVIYFFVSSNSDDELPAVAMSGGSMAVGAITLLVLGAVHAVPMHASTASVTLDGRQMSWLVPVLGISLIAAALAYVLGIAAARALGPKLSSFVSLFEVLFAVIYAWLLLHEVPTWMQGVGGLLILGGVTLVRLDELKSPQAQMEDVPDFVPHGLATLDA